jgi:hypothetical protein
MEVPMAPDATGPRQPDLTDVAVDLETLRVKLAELAERWRSWSPRPGAATPSGCAPCWPMASSWSTTWRPDDEAPPCSRAHAAQAYRIASAFMPGVRGADFQAILDAVIADNEAEFRRRSFRVIQGGRT